MRERVRKVVILSIAVTVLLGTTGCAGSDGVPKDAIAVVGDETVTVEELDRLVELTRATAEAGRRPFPEKGTPQYRQIRDQLVRYLVGRAQLVAAAEERDIEISDEEVEQKRKLLVAQAFGGSEKRYRERLAKQAVSEEQARADLEASLIQQELFDDVAKDVKVTDAEVRKHYDKNKRRYATAARREIRQILVRPDQRALAESLVAEVRSGADFARLARRYSRDPRAETSGGRLEVARGATSPAFERVVFSVPKNKIAGPVRTDFGWHVIEALGPVQRGKTRPFAEVKGQIRRQLLHARKNEVTAKYLVEVATNVEYKAGYAPRA